MNLHTSLVNADIKASFFSFTSPCFVGVSQTMLSNVINREYFGEDVILRLSKSVQTIYVLIECRQHQVSAHVGILTGDRWPAVKCLIYWTCRNCRKNQ